MFFRSFFNRLRMIRPRFSLRTLLLAVLFAGSLTALLRNWAPWESHGQIGIKFRRLHGASFSPDARRIVTFVSGFLTVWDAETGLEIGRSSSSGLAVTASFSPDGRHFATAGKDGKIRLFDWDAVAKNTNNGATKHKADISTDVELTGHTEEVISASFSHDGRQLASASADGTARVWNLESRGTTAILRGHTKWVQMALFSPDGRRIVTASNDDTARIWEASSGREVACLRGHSANLCSAAFSRDGARVVTTSFDGTARIWDADSGALLVTLRCQTGPVLNAAFSHYGKEVFTAGTDGTVRAWDAGTGRQLAILSGHKGVVQSVAVTPSGKIISTGEDGTVRVWNYNHPDTTYGVASLPEFWITMLLAGAAVWSLWRDWFPRLLSPSLIEPLRPKGS